MRMANSADLTCNETMPPLEDGDNVQIDMRRIRSAFVAHHLQHQQQTVLGSSSDEQLLTSPSSSISSLSTPNPNNSQQQSLNHTTTVRDVVTRQIRNSKLNAEAVRFPKFGALFGAAHHQFVDGLSAPPRPDDNHYSQHLLLSNNHQRHNTASHAPSTNGRSTNKYDDSHGGAMLATSTAQMIVKATAGVTVTSNLLPQHIQHVLSAAQQAAPGGGSYIVKMSTTAAAPIVDLGKEQQRSATIQTNHWTLHQQPQQQVVEPQRQHYIHVQQTQQQKPAAATILMTTTAPAARQNPSSAKIAEHNHVQQSAVATAAPNSYTPVMPSSSSHQQQPQPPQQHSSPRPSILRGKASVRRLVDREARPASTNSAASEFNGNNGTTSSRLLNCQSRGDVDEQLGGGADESPRKRQRKQQFDPSQVVQQDHKLKMEVMPQPCNSVASGPTAAASPHSATANNNWRTAPAPPPPAEESSNCGVPANSAITLLPGSMSVSTLLASTMGKKRQTMARESAATARKRGRPKMNCRGAEMPLQFGPNSGTFVPELAATLPSTKHSDQMQYHNNPSLNNSTGQPQPLQGGMQQPRPVMVDVDSMLQTGVVGPLKKRKYRKRTPEIDPDTGKVVKRPRKRAQKSKKELAMEEAAQQAILASMGIFPQQQLASTSAGQQFSQLRTEERDVINALCRFKADSSEAGKRKNSLMRKANAETGEEQQLFPDKKAKKTGGTSKKQAAALKQFLNAAPEQRNIINNNSSASPVQLQQRLMALPLLGDLAEWSQLRPLLRRCEKGLNSTDNCHLGESFEEITAFLEANRDAWTSTSSERANSSGATSFHVAMGEESHLRDEERMTERVQCPIFDSYKEFKASRDSLRLLPLACAYFDASQRLLNSLKRSLLGQGLHQLVGARLRDVKSEEEPIGQTTTQNLVQFGALKLAAAEVENEEEREEREQREFFDRLLDQFGGKDAVREKLAQLEQKFMCQLDVAKTLDSLLDRVDRDHLDSAVRVSHSASASQLAAHCNQEISSSSFTTVAPFRANVRQIVCALPEHLRSLLSKEKRTRNELIGKVGTKRRRKRRVESDEKEDEDGLEAEQCDRSEPDSPNSPSGQNSQHSDELRLLERIGRLNDSAHQHCARIGQFIDGIFPKQEQQTETTVVSSSFLATLAEASRRDAEFRRKRNPHSARQCFIFRPPKPIVEELFKDLPSALLPKKHDEQPIEVPNSALDRNTAAACCSTRVSTQMTDQEAACCSSSSLDKAAKSETSNAKAGPTKGGRSNGKEHCHGGGDEKMDCSLLKADVDEMLANCAHISAVSFAHLRTKHADILGDTSPTNTVQASGVAAVLRSQTTIAKTGDRKYAFRSGTTGQQRLQPFQPTLVHRFPSDSAQQIEYLRARMHEAREQCATVLLLVKSRAALTTQCVQSMGELVDVFNSGGGQQMGGEGTSNGESRKNRGKAANGAKKERPKRRPLSHNLEEEELEEAGASSGGEGEATPAERAPPKLPAKRAAHQRASQMIAATSRVASRDCSIEAAVAAIYSAN